MAKKVVATLKGGGVTYTRVVKWNALLNGAMFLKKQSLILLM